MKKGQKILLLLLLMVAIFVFGISCQKQEDDAPDYTTIETPNLKYENGAYVINLSSTIEKIDLSTYFSISDKATYIISTDANFKTTIDEEVELADGENVFYVKVQADSAEKVYKFIFAKKKSCNVVFKFEGQDEEIGRIQCEEGTKITKPTYSKQGYTIDWQFDFETPITNDTIVVGILIPKKFNITIQASDLDIDVTSYTVEYGKTVNIPSPNKAGYEFTGWLCGLESFDPTKVYTFEKDIIIVPTFNKTIKYTIMYNLNGGTNSINNPSNYTVEDELNFENPTWEDETFTFDGWYTDPEFKESISSIKSGTVGNLILYAKWNKVDLPQEPAKITTNVTIKADGYECDGNVLELVFGENYTLPTISRDGYTNYWTLSGKTIPTVGVWSFEETAVTLEVSWMVVKYDIFYELNGGQNNESNPKDFTIEQEIVLNDPTKEYATFVGWYTDSNYENKIESISNQFGNITLYALWQYTEVEVIFDPNEGEMEELTQTLIYGNNYSLYVPEKNGYTFDGWYKEEELVPMSGQWLFSEGVTLIAKWSLTTYKIEYELNGGTAGVSNVKFEYTIEDDTFTLFVPTKEGQIFLGWSTSDSSAINKILKVHKGMNVGNLKFIANWCDERNEDGFYFNLNEDGTATLMGWYSERITDLTIPSEYNGHKVTSIANNAFNGYGDKITGTSGNNFMKIYIPSTVTRIGANAFANCDDLKVQYLATKEVPLDVWVQSLIIESGNDHVLDVIMSKRPAIGWYKYVK